MRRLAGIISAFALLAAPAWAGIAYVNGADLGNNAGSGNLTVAYTVSGGSNELLLACTVGDTSDHLTGVTYNGVAMTLVAKAATANTRWMYLHYVLGPASGTHNFVFTSSGGYVIPVATEYSGVRQSSQPDASASNNNTSASITTSVTTVANNSWAALCQGDNNSSAAGTGSTLRAIGAAFGDVALYDNNGPVTPAGSVSMTVTSNSGPQEQGTIMASFAPQAADYSITGAVTSLTGLASAGITWTKTTGNFSNGCILTASTGSATVTWGGSMSGSGTGTFTISGSSTSTFNATVTDSVAEALTVTLSNSCGLADPPPFTFTISNRTVSFSGCPTSQTKGATSSTCTVSISSGTFPANGVLTDSGQGGLNGGTFVPSVGSTGTSNVPVPISGLSSFTFTYSPAFIGKMILTLQPIAGLTISTVSDTVTYTGSTFTSIATGNSNVAGTWSCSGACTTTTPGSGDTCILATSFIVTVPNGITFSCGVLPSSLVTGSPDIKISGTGSLVVANGGTLRQQGFAQFPVTGTTNIPSLIVQTGGTWLIDEGNGSTPYYTYSLGGSSGEYGQIAIGSPGDGANCNVTNLAGCPTTVKSINTASATGSVYQNNGSNASQIEFAAYGAVFTSCGSATLGCVQIETTVGGSRDVYTYANDAFLTGGPFISAALLEGNGAGINISGISTDTHPLAVGYLDIGETAGGGGATSTVNLSNSYVYGTTANTEFAGGTVSNVVFDGMSSNTLYAGDLTAALTTNMSNVVIRMLDSTSEIALPGSMTNLLVWGDTCAGCQGNPHFMGLHNLANPINATLTGVILDYGDVGAEGDGLVYSGSTTTINGFLSVPSLINGIAVSSVARATQAGSAPAGYTALNITHASIFGGGLTTQGGYYLTENSPSSTTPWPITYKNSIYAGGGNSNALYAGTYASTSYPNTVPVAGIDYNTNWNYKAVSRWNSGFDANCTGTITSNGSPYDLCLTGTFGAHDINVNPLPVDATRHLTTWGALHGHASAIAAGGYWQPTGAMAYLASCAPALGTCISDLFSYMRAGYAVQNPQLLNAGSDGMTIGCCGFGAGAGSIIFLGAPALIHVP